MRISNFPPAGFKLSLTAWLRSAGFRLVLWARRHRRILPAPLVVLTLVFFEPLSTGNAILDSLTSIVGAAICGFGQSLRLWAWGSNANVGTTGIRDRGPYAIMRHPLYAGNFLIVCGIVVSFNNPWVYGLTLLPFACLYHLIARKDEAHMRSRVGADYENYAVRVTTRLLPNLSNLGGALRTTRPFSWKHGWRKEFDSCCAWLSGLAGLGIYKATLTYGWKEAGAQSWGWLLVLGISVSLVLVKTGHKQLSQESTKIPARPPLSSSDHQS